ncbi:Flavonol synthase/flavanone 3-hydroxylase-like protein [Drosera capensis]
MDEKDVYAKPSDPKDIEGYGTKLQKQVEGKKAWVYLLEINYDELNEAVGGEDLVYLLKINYYPPCPRPDLALGVVAHTGMSAITILVLTDVPGLQVLSNGKYKAVLHRTTVNKDKTRMSWPVFLEPPAVQEIGPHPKLIDDQENPAKYKTKNYSDYVYCKLNKIQQ